jgi:signal transduction histidine kinase
VDKSRILIVDDDRNVPSLLARVLERAGYEVATAPGGEEALGRFAERRPEVVVTDLRMPGMDGREFIRRLLSDYPDVMVLVLTGYGTIPETVELIRAGVFSVLTKPLRIEDITFMVGKAAAEFRMRQQNRDLERRLQTSERLAMIGKLAAGVAHELNNPLDGVTRFVKLARDGLPSDSDGHDFLDAAIHGLRRMSSIVKDLLTFSRNVVIEAEEEALESLLREAVSQIVAARSGDRLDVRFDLAVPGIRVPRGMFQVFQNLVSNAADAVTPEGVIEISARIEDGELLLAVRDNGAGIPEEIRDRVFEPFFTTKEPGRGTGLGLSIVARIMERFGGGVSLESEVGRGTTVTVFLPCRKMAKETVDAGARCQTADVHPAR